MFRNGFLLAELVRRDFRIRFTGSALGLAWAVLQPLTLVALYWFVFTFMIPRAPVAGMPAYSLFLISGLLPWIGINEGIMRATTSIVDNAALVRRLMPRVDILVVVPNLTAALFEMIGLALMILFLVFRGLPLRGLWLLPLALLVQVLLQIGISWFLAASFVFFRDVIQVLGFLLSVVFYLSPILYSVEGPFERFFAWNPLTPLMGLFRSAMLSAPLPDLFSVVFLVGTTALIFLGGIWFFRRVRPSFVDLIF